MLIVPNNWSELQHYKDRSPPWIKLHKKLLDNYEFQSLPVASRALAPMLWLLASEHEKGYIDAAPEKLAFRLRMTETAARDALKPLMDKAFFAVVHDASKPLAEVVRAAMPETEGETETEKKPRASRAASFPRPEDVTEQTWADWVQLRKAKRATVSQTVVNGARTEAAKAGMSLESFLQVWCRRGSQGLEAEWIKPKERASAQQDDPKEWHETQSGVKRRAQELGLKPWNEIEEQWPAFRQRVMKADKGAAGGFLSVDQLFQMAQERSAA